MTQSFFAVTKSVRKVTLKEKYRGVSVSWNWKTLVDSWFEADKPQNPGLPGWTWRLMAPPGGVG